MRGFSPGCQPMESLIERQDDWTGKYLDVLVYNRELSKADCEHYDLDFIAIGEASKYAWR